MMPPVQPGIVVGCLIFLLSCQQQSDEISDNLHTISMMELRGPVRSYLHQEYMQPDTSALDTLQPNEVKGYLFDTYGNLVEIQHRDERIELQYTQDRLYRLSHFNWPRNRLQTEILYYYDAADELIEKEIYQYKGHRSETPDSLIDRPSLAKEERILHELNKFFPQFVPRTHDFTNTSNGAIEYQYDTFGNWTNEFLHAKDARGVNYLQRLTVRQFEYVDESTWKQIFTYAQATATELQAKRFGFSRNYFTRRAALDKPGFVARFYDCEAEGLDQLKANRTFMIGLAKGFLRLHPDPTYFSTWTISLISMDPEETSDRSNRHSTINYQFTTEELSE